MEWKKHLAQAAFGPRDTADCVVHNGKLFLSNGYIDAATPPWRDLWRSDDGGVSWARIQSSTPYPAYAALVSYAGDLWAFHNSVWKSCNDGYTWEQVASTCFIDSPGALPTARAFNGEMWVFAQGQCWSTADGLSWTNRGTPDNRWSMGVAVLGYKIYLMGGACQVAGVPPEMAYPGRKSFNDVWSNNGTGWLQETANAGWSKRMWPAVVAHCGKLVLFGGFSNETNQNVGETWVSPNGHMWSRLAGAEPSPRHWASLFSVGPEVVLAAGNAWPVQRDVWRLRFPL